MCLANAKKQVKMNVVKTEKTVIKKRKDFSSHWNWQNWYHKKICGNPNLKIMFNKIRPILRKQRKIHIQGYLVNKLKSAQATVDVSLVKKYLTV